MKIEVERDAFSNALKLVAQVVEARNTIPVLGNLLLVAEGGTLTVTGTDLDRQASATLTCTGELATTVDKDKLVAAVGSFPAGAQLAIEAADGKVVIKGGRGRRTLPTLKRDDFPRMLDPEGPRRFAISAGVLARLFDATQHAQSVDETRYYLQGVLLHGVDGKLRAAASDGHRVIRAETAAPEGAEDLPNAIVPTKSVAMLRGLLAKQDVEVTVAIADDRAVFETGAMRLITKLIDGSFPDYSRTIPGEAEPNLRAERETLSYANDAVAAVVAAEGDKVKRRVLKFEIEGDKLTVSAVDTSGAAAVEEAPVASGAPITFGMNHRYMSQALSIFSEGATISLALADANAPMRLTSDKDPDLLAVIMPMRV